MKNDGPSIVAAAAEYREAVSSLGERRHRRQQLDKIIENIRGEVSTIERRAAAGRRDVGDAKPWRRQLASTERELADIDKEAAKLSKRVAELQGMLLSRDGALDAYLKSLAARRDQAQEAHGACYMRRLFALEAARATGSDGETRPTAAEVENWKTAADAARTDEEAARAAVKTVASLRRSEARRQALRAAAESLEPIAREIDELVGAIKSKAVELQDVQERAGLLGGDRVGIRTGSLDRIVHHLADGLARLRREAV